MKQTGDKVCINGKEYTLGESLGGGLEGTVFNVVELPKYVIKLINAKNKNNGEIKKIREHLIWLKDVVGQNDDLKSKMALPKAVLDDELGYIMLRVNSKDCSSLSKYLDYPKEQQSFFEWCRDEYNLKKRLQICANLFRTLEKIHISGMLFTDISPNNIMIHKTQNGLVFIDTDNTRRRSDPYINVLGTEGYMAPEMFDCIDPQTLSKAKELRVDEDIFMHSAKISTESDVFAAAIIAFQILTLQHPFVGDEVEFGTADDEANALRCKTDYILKLGTNNSSSQPLVKYFDECKIITSKVKLLFETLFVDGKNIPALRPTAMDFFEAFDECLDLLTTCPHCGVSRLISYDSPQFSPAKIECWYCEKEWNSPVSLKIYNDYQNAKNREEIVNLILSEEILENTTKEKSRFFEVSEIILNEKEPKYLYKRHFENVNQRSTPYAVLELKDAESKTMVFTSLDNNNIPDCYLIEKGQKETSISVKAGKEFSYEKYYLLFEIKDTRLGKIRTIGCFFDPCSGVNVEKSKVEVYQNPKRSDSLIQLAVKIIQIAEKVYKLDNNRISKSEIFNSTYSVFKNILSKENPNEYSEISSLEPDFAAIVQYLKQWD